jgi:hypothetical protein
MIQRIKNLVNQYGFIVQDIYGNYDDTYENFNGYIAFPKISQINFRQLIHMYLDDSCFTNIESKNDQIKLNFHISI